MNYFTEIDCRQALELLKQGWVLQSLSQPVLFKYSAAKEILVSGLNYHLKLQPADFCELYADTSFRLRQEKAQIDELKDEEYYQWRFHHQ